MTIVAVETSDLVGSTKLESDVLKRVIAALTAQLDVLVSKHNIHYEFYRGDGFQIYYPDVSKAFRLSLSIKLFMLYKLPKKIQVTQSLAIDSAEMPIKTLHDRMDKAFVTSGRMLEKTPRGELNINLALSSEAQKLLLDWFNQNLKSISSKQAEVLYWFIIDDFPEQKKIAQRLDMTRQNVNAQLRRVNANLIKRYVLLIENQISEIIK